MSEPPPVQRILALDLGKARIGVAVSDPLGWTAQPVEMIPARPADKAIGRIRALAGEYDVTTIVVGLPVKMDGNEGEQAAWVRQFAGRIARAVRGVSIVYWDERLTTAASESLLIESGVSRAKRKQHRDKIAAALILQSFLEQHHSASGS
jgi:putative Holliday junction resolvase